MNPWPVCLNNLHGAIEEFTRAVSDKNYDLARELISDIWLAFGYIGEHAEQNMWALVREAATHTVDRIARGIPPDYVAEKPAG